MKSLAAGPASQGLAEPRAQAMLGALCCTVSPIPGGSCALSAALLPWRPAGAIVCLAAGLIWGLVVAPPDYQQGESVRIMYVHVPAAWMALFVYLLIAVASAGALIWRHPLADLIAQAASPLGAGFTFIALVTGSLWGKPMWGTWWVWDARLTSMLILFFLYLGHIALPNAFDDAQPRQPRGRDPGARRRRQRADHQILGRLVEHAASAGERVPHGRADHRSLDAVPLLMMTASGLHLSCCCSSLRLIAARASRSELDARVRPNLRSAGDGCGGEMLAAERPCSAARSARCLAPHRTGSRWT